MCRITIKSKHSAYIILTTLLMLMNTDVLARKIEILYLGHSTVRITSQTGKVIVIDPFLTRNPMTPPKYKNLEALGHVDLILVTHGHGDHVGDLVKLAKLTKATVIANYEYGLQLMKMGYLDPKRTIPMNKGGEIAPLGRGIKIYMVRADHSSSVDLELLKEDLKPGEPRFLEGGVAVGYVIELENGFRIYDSGDTELFGDMALIGKRFHPDLAIVCIGGHFTMGPEDAAYALREYIKPKQVIGVHYGTYPIINRTPAELKAALGKSSIEVLPLAPGQSVQY